MKPSLRNTVFPVSIKNSLLLFLLLFVCGTVNAAGFWYVKPTASGTGLGTSWANAAGATQLQTIINGAASGDQVWVAAGTYIPVAVPVGSAGTGSNNYSFNPVNGVAVYGGFAGGETLLSQRNITTNVTILSGNNISYHVVMSAGNTGTAILDGFTIEKGSATGINTQITYGGQNFNYTFGGGIICMSSAPAISNCIISGNTASSGGGLYNRSSPGPIFTNCTFSGNVATSTGDGGGAVYDYSGDAVTFATCTFSGNSASNNEGGASYSAGGTLSYTTCTFSSNSASLDGGAIFVTNSSTLTVSDCAFNSNTAGGAGGAIAIESSNTATISNSSFSLNVASSATYGGGGIFNESNAGATITQCSFTSNRAVNYGGGFLGYTGSNGSILSYSTFSSDQALYGGGMANYNGSALTVKNCKISNCSATYGGGVYNQGGTQYYTTDTIANNTASSTSGVGGGGMLNDASENPVISHCWFSGNVTSGANGAGQYDVSNAGVDSNCVFQANIAGGTTSNGGGLYHAGGTGSFLNCVFVNNSCGGNGGAIDNYGNSENYQNCTLYNNSSGNAATGGDGIYVDQTTKPHITADIIWSSNASSVGLVIGSGTPKINYSDIQGVTTTFLSTYGTANINSAPSFGNSGNYAGTDGMWATADDGLHLTGSAAADAVTPGNFLSDDITDFARPDAGSVNADMGAYEGGGTFYTLAVQLLNFTATAAGGNMVDVDWRVDATGQASQFVVQRSVTGTNFVAIGSEGVLSGQTAYRFVDPQANGETIYYRLKMVMADGNEAYSAVAIVRNGLSAMRFSLRPSVATQGSTTLYIGSPQAVNISLIMVDAAGQVLSKRSLVVGQGDNYVPVELGGLPNGLYFLCVSGEGISRQTLTLEKL